MSTINISGEFMVFRNEHDGANGKWYTYTTTVSGKKMDGTYTKPVNKTVRFRKGVVLENKTKINVSNGFVSAREYVNKNGEEVREDYYFVLDFDIVGGGNYGAQEQYTAMTMDDVPF